MANNCHYFVLYAIFQNIKKTPYNKLYVRGLNYFESSAKDTED